jgi:AcrR family transcriptional regulator
MPRLSSTRKELLTALMKDAIHDAAVSVLAEHGMDGMTMDRVAAAANLAKGSLYSYFDSKQDLLRFVHAKLVDPILESADDIVRSELPAAEKLHSILHIVFDQLAKHCGLFNLLLQDDIRMLLEPTKQTNREIAIGQFTAIFRQGIKQGIFRPLDPAQLAQMFFGAMVQLWHRALAADESAQAEESARLLIDVFLNGLAVPSRTRLG